MTWIQATSQQMSPTLRLWPFLPVFGEKGAQAGTQSPGGVTKGWGEGAAAPASMDRSNCGAARSPGEAGREMKEAQMSPCWTSPRSAASEKTRKTRKRTTRQHLSQRLSAAANSFRPRRRRITAPTIKMEDGETKVEHVSVAWVHYNHFITHSLSADG